MVRMTPSHQYQMFAASMRQRIDRRIEACRADGSRRRCAVSRRACDARARLVGEALPDAVEQPGRHRVVGGTSRR